MNHKRFGDDLSIYIDTPMTFCEGEAYPTIEIGYIVFIPKIVRWNTRMNQASKFRTSRGVPSKYDNWITVPGIWIAPSRREYTYEQLRKNAHAGKLELRHTFVIPNTIGEEDD